MLITSLSTVTAFAAPAGVRDFTITSTAGTSSLTEGTDYSFSGGKLTVNTGVPLNIGMKDGVDETDNIILISNEAAPASVKLKNVRINVNSGKNYGIELKGTEEVTLEFSGTNSILNTAGTGIYAGKTPLRITSDDF